jgi:HK97 family phage prohead protease
VLIRSTTLTDVQADGRTLTGILVPYGSPGAIVDDGEGPYREVFAPGSVQLRSDAAVYADHTPGPRPVRGPLIGRVVDGQHTPTGFRATMRIADTSAGRDVLALIADGVVTGLSVEFDALENATGPDGTVTRVRADVSGVAITPRPAYAAAQVIGVRAASLDAAGVPYESESPVSDTPDTPATPDPDTPAPADDDSVRARAAVIAVRHEPHPATPVVHGVAARFRSLGEYAAAVRDRRLTDDDAATIARAWTDVITGDVPGLMPPNWMTEIIDLMRVDMVTVDAFRRAPLPETGELSITVPRVKTRPTMGKQATQKTAIASTKVEIETVPFAIDTYAGGNDIAIQALRRARPDLLTEYLRLYAQEAARLLDTAVAAAVVDAADVNTAVNIDADDPNAGMVAAAKSLLTAIRRFPEVIVVGVDLWEALATATGTDGRPLFPTLNPMNQHGTVSLANGSGQVRDVSLVVDALFPAGKGVMGTRDAFVSYIGPLGTLSADVPNKLGRDVAVYVEAAFGARDAHGLVLLNAPAAAAAP